MNNKNDTEFFEKTQLLAAFHRLYSEEFRVIPHYFNYKHLTADSQHHEYSECKIPNQSVNANRCSRCPFKNSRYRKIIMVRFVFLWNFGFFKQHSNVNALDVAKHKCPNIDSGFNLF